MGRKRDELEKANLTKQELEYLIDNTIVGRNAERNRCILKRRLVDGICFEPLSDEFCLSVRQTKQIVYKCTDKIISHI